MRSAAFSPAAVVFAATLSIAAAAPAEELVLRPRYQPGDSYILSLSATTRTQARSAGETRKSVDEDVLLDYSARVVILETDRSGFPVRERHQDVRLTSTRPGESGSLFGAHTQYEVRRERDGDVRIYLDHGQRMDGRIEKVVAELLDGQFEYTLGPALLDPGRPVRIGESWQLDRSLARRFLAARGVRVVEFGKRATATLQRSQGEDSTGDLVIQYSIPIARAELKQMPPNTQTARSEARFEGEIRLSPDPRGDSLVHSSTLTLTMNGAVTKPGVARAVPWSLDSSQLLGQHTLVVEKAAVSGL